MPTTLLPGSEFQINVNSGGNNGISGAQDLADITLLPDGRFVVAYQSDYFGSATDTDPIAAIFSEVGGTSLADLPGTWNNLNQPRAFLTRQHGDNQLWEIVPSP